MKDTGPARHLHLDDPLLHRACRCRSRSSSTPASCARCRASTARPRWSTAPSHWQSFTRVIFPLLRPITGTVVILNAVFIWNDFFTPLVYLGGTAQRDAPGRRLPVRRPVRLQLGLHLRRGRRGLAADPGRVPAAAALRDQGLRQRTEGLRRMRAVGLRCEHREDIPCVDDPAPRLSWALEDGASARPPTGSRVGRAVGQRPGRVRRTRSTSPYAGPPLPPRERARVDASRSGTRRRVVRSSEPARFRTGLGRVDRAQWIAPRPDPRPRGARPRHRRGARRDRHADAAAVAVPVPAARRSRSPPTCAARRCTRPRAAWSSSSSTARASATRCSRPAGPTTASASSTPRTTSPRCCATARTRSARSSATAGTPASSASTRAGRATTTAREPELLCELHLEHADGTREIVASDARWHGHDRARSSTRTC